MDRRIGRGRVSRATFVRIGTTSLPELEPRHEIASIIGYADCLSLSLGSAACTSSQTRIVQLLLEKVNALVSRLLRLPVARV